MNFVFWKNIFGLGYRLKTLKQSRESSVSAKLVKLEPERPAMPGCRLNWWRDNIARGYWVKSSYSALWSADHICVYAITNKILNLKLLPLIDYITCFIVTTWMKAIVPKKRLIAAWFFCSSSFEFDFFKEIKWGMQWHVSRIKHFSLTKC